MKFKPGISGNPTGRPKGAANKAGADLRQRIADFLNEKFEGLVCAFDGLEAKDKVKAYTDLLQYGLPKLQAMQLETDFERMTDEQLDKVIEELKNAAV